MWFCVFFGVSLLAWDLSHLSFVGDNTLKETLINFTVAANCCVMRCSKCSHISEYAALSALLLLALYSPQRITQSLLNSLSQTNSTVISLAYSYVGSIGAEAFIRYWDGISWDKLPNLKLTFLGAKSFSLGNLIGCFFATVTYLAAITYTEITNFESIRLSFTAVSFNDLPYDLKFILVIFVGILFRTYIYFNASSSNEKNDFAAPI